MGVLPSVGSIVTISKDVGSNDSGTGTGTGGAVVPDSVGAGVSGVMGTQSGGVGALFSALVEELLEDPPLEDPPLEEPPLEPEPLEDDPLEDPPLEDEPLDDSPLSDLEDEAELLPLSPLLDI